MLHRLDPRTKFIVTIVFILAVVITPPATWYSFVFYLAIVAAMVLLSRVPVLYIFKRSLLILPFIGIIAISVPFMKQGEVIGSITIWSWKISVTQTGLELFAGILLKAWLSALSLILLTATTRVVDLLKGLEQLRVPRILIMIISFMYRYIFVLTDDMMRMKQARDSRNFGGRRMWQIKTLGNMIGILFVRSYERGERIYSAMLSRGYDGQTRTLRKLKLQTADFAFGIVSLGIIISSYFWIILLY
jgi:cobalt/nickel transport system permease protein